MNCSNNGPIKYLCYSNNCIITNNFVGCCSKFAIYPPNFEPEFDDEIFMVSNCFNVKEVVLPLGMETLYCGFWNIYALEKLFIPKTVTEVKDPFYRCVALRELNFTEHEQVPVFNPQVGTPFEWVSSMLVIKVPKSLETEWKSAASWSAFADRIVGV